MPWIDGVFAFTVWHFVTLSAFNAEALIVLRLSTKCFMSFLHMVIISAYCFWIRQIVFSASAAT